MFCPKCGLGDISDQKFCRGCGHALAGHRVALENNFEEMVETIKSGSTALGLSAIGLIVMSLMCLGIWITQKDGGVFYTLIPVLAAMIPAAILGLVRLTRVYRALSASDTVKSKTLLQSQTNAIHLTPEAAATDPLGRAAESPVSVTEHTTLNLEPRGRGSDDAHTGEVDSPKSAS